VLLCISVYLVIMPVYHNCLLLSSVCFLRASVLKVFHLLVHHCGNFAVWHEIVYWLLMACCTVLQLAEDGHVRSQFLRMSSAVMIAIIRLA